MFYRTVYIFDRIFALYIIYYDVGPQKNLLLLDSQSYHKYLIPIFWWLLSFHGQHLPRLTCSLNFVELARIFESFGQ